MTSHTRIGFIGAGNMASALIRGMLDRGYAASSLLVSDPDAAKVTGLENSCGITGVQDNISLAGQVDILVLAVKPQVMAEVVEPLAKVLGSRTTLLLSVAAGIPIARFTGWTSTSQAVVRCMPNTPALVGLGASALFANPECSVQQCREAEAILAAVGEVVWLETEAQMDAVTALSGSGPAYFFLLLEAMQEAAIGLGLTPEVARALSLQTALGASTLARTSDEEVAELRRRVSSPGGTTEAALKQFEAEDFRGIVKRALSRAAERSRELAG